MKLSLIHPNALIGINLFNKKEYFEAHEELELAWRAENSWIKEMYRGILQVGVAYYHIQKKNFSGAKKMFERSFKWLAPYPDVCYGINIMKLKLDAQIAYEQLLLLGQDHIDQFDPIYFKPLEFQTEDE
jgi:predicted metal-dependent hydrolase